MNVIFLHLFANKCTGDFCNAEMSELCFDICKNKGLTIVHNDSTIKF